MDESRHKFTRGFLRALASNGVSTEELNDYIKQEKRSNMMLPFGAGAGVAGSMGPIGRLARGFGIGAGNILFDVPTAIGLLGGGIGGIGLAKGYQKLDSANKSREAKDKIEKYKNDLIAREVALLATEVERRNARNRRAN